MKRKTLLGSLLLICLVPVAGLADQVNWNFTTGANGSVVASMAGGFKSGPSALTSISDSTNGMIVPISGTYTTGNTGPASSFAIGSLVVATFTGDGPDSVFVISSGATTLVSGTMRDGASMLSTFPAGTGSFLGTFDVSFVDPANLALFGLGPGFDPVGSVALTFAGANVSGGVLTASIGGGAVTIETPSVTPVPEVGTLLLLGTGLLAVGWKGHRRLNRIQPA